MVSLLYTSISGYASYYDKATIAKIMGSLWKAYLEYVIPADYVPRCGYYLCDVYPEPEIEGGLMRTSDHLQSDNEHSYSAMWWAENICRAFPQIVALRVMRDEVVNVLRIHDLFESKIGGDTPDVSERNNEDKDTQETRWAITYGLHLPDVDYRDRLLANFFAFQDKTTVLGQIAYCFDKIDAVLRGLAFEHYGRIGSVGNRGFASDDESIRITGTTRMTDNWFDTSIRKISPYECSDFFVHIVAEVFRIERGEYPAWLEKIKHYEFLD